MAKGFTRALSFIRPNAKSAPIPNFGLRYPYRRCGIVFIWRCISLRKLALNYWRRETMLKKPVLAVEQIAQYARGGVGDAQRLACQLLLDLLGGLQGCGLGQIGIHQRAQALIGGIGRLQIGVDLI